MGFRFEWSKEKTVIRYLAEGNDWNWKDYHLCVRTSLFIIEKNDRMVDSLIDFRGSTRETFPSGFAAHVRSFGKKLAPNLTGRAVVIGIPLSIEESLGLNPDRQLLTSDGFVQFVDTDDDAKALLRGWQAQES